MKNHWLSWLAFLSFLLLIDILLEKSTQWGFLFELYVIPTWIFIMYKNFVHGRELMKYLENNHKEKWEELTTVPITGSGGVNGFKSIPFIYSSEDLNDKKVTELKGKYKNFIKFILFIFITIIPINYLFGKL